jgi:lactoylglutathione lyase
MPGTPKYPLDHIVIYASDIVNSVKFYDLVLGILGFEKKRDHIYLRGMLAFDLREAFDEGEAYERGRPGVDHLGFSAPDRECIDTIFLQMSAGGFEGGRIIDFDSGDYALFLPDPDGVRLEITHYVGTPFPLR